MDLESHTSSELKPNPEGGWADYTVPIVQFPDSSLVMVGSPIPHIRKIYSILR